MPLVPADQAWLVTLPSPPSANGAMDANRIYIPVQPEQIVALDRETGDVVWTRDIESVWPPVVHGDHVYVAASDEIHSLDGATGQTEWRVSFQGAMIAPLTWACDLLIGVMAPGEVVAFQSGDGHVVWRKTLATLSHHAPVCQDERVVVAEEAGKVVALDAKAGTPLWEQSLPGTLSQPAVARGRVFVGSNDNFLYALNASTGKLDWKWRAGGDVVGSAADDQGVVYFASLDNILRAVNRGNGNQRWMKEIANRPAAPPQAFGRLVLMTGVTPQITAYTARTGVVLGTYNAPGDLAGPPLVDPVLKPYHVGFAVITRDGRAAGLRPVAMLFKEVPLGPLVQLPGRRLARETLH